MAGSCRISFITLRTLDESFCFFSENVEMFPIKVDQSSPNELNFFSYSVTLLQLTLL